ncbi:hypothetical protein BGW37DRAFT_553439 [Umbelopsis sp. PMI_123]|nr:hypothetical protein BGW37DRAFT_553439 [Umbelopsis sp. PMI_123]
MLNVVATANLILTARDRTESVQKCKQMNYDPLTNQTVLSDDLCTLKWCLAMTAVSVTYFVNMLLDVLFIFMLRRMSRDLSSKFLFPYDDPENPLHFRTQRLRDTMVKGEPRPTETSYPLHDRQLSQSSIADILTGEQSAIKAA